METLFYDIIQLKNLKKATLVFKDQTNQSTEYLLNSPSEVTVSDSALQICVLPENVRISNKEVESSSGCYWRTNIVIDIPSQFISNWNLLKNYKNKSGVVFLETESEVYVYGNTHEPLRFLFGELNPKKNDGLVGFQLTAKGNTTFDPLIIPIKNMQYYNFLAQDLPIDF